MPEDAAWPVAPGEPPAVRLAAPGEQGLSERGLGERGLGERGLGEQGSGGPEPAGEPPTEVNFRVDGRLTGIRIAGAVIFLLVALAFNDDRGRLVVAGLAGLLCAGYAVRDLLVPHRLAADAEGVTVVSGLGRRRRLGWDQIEGVRRDERRRLGTRSELLEIDAGNNLYLFSGYDLGMPCWRAAEQLAAIAPPH